METLGPVTLIVKAPNQKIEDRRVACDKSWTVGQLKEHLSTVYPERPHRDQQKLVYYGKLLRDDSCLHEVLKHDTYDDAHTIHIVCPQHSTSTPVQSHPVIPPRPATMTTPTTTEQPGLRHRHHPPQQTGVGITQPQILMPPSYQEFMNSYLSQVQQWQVNQSAITPQQRMWILACHQQYNAFIVQYNQMMLANSRVQSVDTPDLPADAGEPAAAAAAAPAGNNNEDEVVRMDAQGGVDQDVVQQDWLDHLYTLIRFGMLLMLLYFYTTVGRFAIVVGVALFFYFAQGNFFRVQRRRVAAEPREPNINGVNGEAQAAPEGDAANNDNNNDVTDGENSEQEQQQQQQEATASLSDNLKLVLTFFVSFFSSIVPQNPAALAGN